MKMKRSVVGRRNELHNVTVKRDNIGSDGDGRRNEKTSKQFSRPRRREEWMKLQFQFDAIDRNSQASREGQKNFYRK